MPEAGRPKRASSSRKKGEAAIGAASALEDARAQLRRSGKLLHDEIGPLIGAAGLRLQLLRMDHPEASQQVEQVLNTLEDAMDRIRELSQALSPSPFAAAPAPAIAATAAASSGVPTPSPGPPRRSKP